jgi:hypothetical protein
MNDITSSVLCEGLGAGAARGGSAAAAPASSSLECLRNTVGSEHQEEEFHIVGNRCKSWFCDHCAKIQGPRLRAKLIDRVASWQSPMMLTFTIDPDLFETPEDAFKHVTRTRALAHVMRMLSECLASPGYFAVIEWQENGWPHWHVLCDSVCIPIEKARQAWAKFVPADRRHLVRPKIGSLGIVRFSKPGWCKNAKHAALYVSKYLTKYPDDGFPAWVMAAKYRIRRFSTSRGFWGQLSHRKASASIVEDESDVLEDEAGTREARTHSERLGTCCRSCTVYRVNNTIDFDTGETKRVRTFFRRLSCQPFVLVGIVRDFMQDFPDVLPAFVRGAFVQWRSSWQDFIRTFGSHVESGDMADFVAMRLES